MTLLRAVVAGGGSMAQFEHPALGGMTMVGDIFDSALKAKVDGLSGDLPGLL